MKTFARYLFALVAVLVLLVIGRPSFASTAPVTMYMYSGPTDPLYASVAGVHYATANDACAAAGALWQGSGRTGTSSYGPPYEWYYGDHYCYAQPNSGTGGGWPFTTVQSVSSCANGDGTWSNPVNGSCPDPKPATPTCTAGATGQASWYEGHSASASAQIPDGGRGPFPTSDGSCEIVVIEVVRCTKTAASGGGSDFYCTYGYRETGNVKAGTAPSSPPASGGPASQPPTPDPTPNDSCPKGTSQVGVDSSGIPMCAGNGSNPAPAPTPPKTEQTTTQQNPDGSTTTTKTTTQQNSDGSTTTTTTTTTTGADGKTTTSTSKNTGKASDGSDGKEDGNPDDAKYDLCKSHPDLNICRNSSVTGTCGEISCEGDAIQCAMLRDQAIRNCSDKEDADKLKELGVTKLGDQVLSGSDPDASNLPRSDRPEVVNVVPSLDSSGWAGGGACFADKSVSVMGRSFTVPFSAPCEYLVALRYALMVAAFLIAYRMLSGVILSEG